MPPLPHSDIAQKTQTQNAISSNQIKLFRLA